MADGSLYGPFGVMGGYMQPQGHVQVVVGLVDDGASPQAVLDRPRFCIEPIDGQVQLGVDDSFPQATFSALAARGHAAVSVTGFDRALFGRGQIIRREPDGSMAAGSEPRGDGCAAST